MQDAPDVPYVSLAAFCDRLLQEQDGTISLIRVIDRLTVTASGTLPVDQMPPLGIQVNAVLGFKSGRVQGPREVSLTVKGPQNTVLERKQPVPVHFPGGHLGFNLAFTLGFESREAGVHWIDVLVDENLVTSMPLEIVHEVQTSQQNQTSEAPEQE